jgi:hypothetical protein
MEINKNQGMQAMNFRSSVLQTIPAAHRAGLWPLKEKRETVSPSTGT